MGTHPIFDIYMKKQIKICFLSDSIFHWGKYGGYGKLTRDIGKELVKRGVQVTIAVPKSTNQKTVEILDGMKVIGYPKVPLKIQYFSNLIASKVLVDSNIFHSTGESADSYIVERTHPFRKHIITFGA